MKEILKLCEKIARESHKGKKRRWSKDNYIVHPEAVAKLVKTDELKCIAWLHDVIEDTKLTIKDLDNLGVLREITRSIAVLTREENENYLDYILQIAPYEDTTLVKLADLEHNLSNLHEGSLKDKYLLAQYILKKSLEK